MKKNRRMHSARIARMRGWWRAIGLPTRLTILGLVVGVLSLVPSYLALFDNRSPEGSSPAAPPASAPAAAPSGATNTSLRQPSSQAALRLDGAYNRTPLSIMWALPRALPPGDDLVIQTPNLAGNDPAQNKIGTLLLKRGGVKIEADQTEDFRPHSQVRLIVMGQHERPVLITGLRANVLRRERPLSQTLVYGPPQGADENIQVGLDLDSRTPYARSFDKDKRFLAEPYFAAHHVSVKPGEQVVFTVRAFTSKCYCEWELLVTAVVDGKDQVFSVKDGDQPFRTTAFATAYKTIYDFDFFKNRFVKLPPGSRFPPPQSGP
jgi:hypothetical protein